MGKVAITFKLMPESAELELGSVKEDIKKTVARHPEMQLNVLEEKPVAFGLKCIEILIVMPDSSISGLEQEMSRIKGIASVESGDVTLI